MTPRTSQVNDMSTDIGAGSVSGTDPGTGRMPPVPNEVVPVRHYGRMGGAVVVGALALWVVYGFATNPNIKWSVVGEFVFNASILKGLLTTLEMTALAMVISLFGAVVVAVMRLSPSRIISGVATAYVFVFRGVPLILLLIFLGNLGLFVKTIVIGVPFTDVVFVDMPSSELITPFTASVLGLSLAGSAYMGEVVRGGMLGVGKGQREAAKALGVSPFKSTRMIVLPQAMRIIVPPLGNELIGMLKSTAIVSVIAGGDILTVAQSISGSNYRTIELLLVAAIWYFAVLAVVSAVQYLLEKRIAER